MEFLILSKGNPINSNWGDTVWGFVTSRRKAEAVCNAWNKWDKSGRIDFYYIMRPVGFHKTMCLDGVITD